MSFKVQVSDDVWLSSAQDEFVPACDYRDGKVRSVRIFSPSVVVLHRSGLCQVTYQI